MFGNDLLLSGEVVPNLWDDRNESVRLYSEGRSNHSIPSNPSVRSSSVPRPKSLEVPDPDDPLYPRPPEDVYVMKRTSKATSSTAKPVAVTASETETVETVTATPQDSVTASSEPPTVPPTPPVTMSTGPKLSTATQADTVSNPDTKVTWWRPPIKIWTEDPAASEFSQLDQQAC
ncbi:hypothetical protein I317_00310 [Kwoniella heveanensis CBS 569]|nr:hypothetical protein I317_00310 [Kwoniella heveanensis CBS 569]